MSHQSLEEQMQRAQEAQQKYAAMLLALPHVVGVGIGYHKRDGQLTEIVGLVVMVDQPIVAHTLPDGEVIPQELDGVPVDVQEMGVFSAGAG